MRSVVVSFGIPLVVTACLWIAVEIGLRQWGGDWVADVDDGLVREYAQGRLLRERIGGQDATLAWDPRLLWRLPHGEWTDRWGLIIRINGLGIRGPEVRTPKPPNELRVLGLGDSGVFGFGVDEHETYLALGAHSAGFVSFNGGVPGYSTYQAINMFQMVKDSVRPDVVLVSNLWGDIVVQGFHDKDLLTTHEEMANQPIWKLNKRLEEFAIYRFLRLQVWKRNPPPPNAIMEQPANFDQHNGNSRVSLEEYRANLNALASMASEDGAQVVFLVPAVSDDLDKPDAIKLSKYRMTMREIGKKYDATVVEMPNVLRQSGLPANELFLDGTHLSVKGHQQVGPVIASALLLASNKKSTKGP